MQKKVVIIGGGFAGIQAAKKLYKNHDIQLTILDYKDDSTFLPLLPDIISGNLAIKNITFSLTHWCKKRKINFINEAVIEVLSNENIIKTPTQQIDYDYLLITTGSETNYYGNKLITNNSLKLDDVRDASTIKVAALSDNIDHVLVSGGGYTGIETATHLRLLFDKQGLDKKISIVEFSPKLLRPMPEWIRKHVVKNLYSLKINCLINSQVTNIEETTITINEKDTYERAMLVWSSGVKAVDIIKQLNGEKDRQERVLVDKNMHISDNVFACGDSCQFIEKDMPLRMSVRFAVDAAKVAAKNIINSISKKPLITFKSHDPGYIIPMANNNSIGLAEGIKVKGKLATFLHYALCFWFSEKSNKLGLLKNLLSR